MTALGTSYQMIHDGWIEHLLILLDCHKTQNFPAHTTKEHQQPAT